MSNKNFIFEDLNKRLLLNTRIVRRYLNASDRVFPDYLIIGAQKAGTSSLKNYLWNHPNIIKAFKKEVKYFDCNYSRGERWYRLHFPLINELQGEKQITGEASPYYIFHPLAAKRIRKDLPEVKLIALLRNPIDRAYSHYQYNLRTNRETLSFEEAIEREEKLLEGVEEKIIADNKYPLYKHMFFSYFSRGIYVNQLERWFSHFPKDQILILKNEDFLENINQTMEMVTTFLGVKTFDFGDGGNLNVGNYPKMNSQMRKKLTEKFKPHNQKLFSLLNRDFGWNS